MEEREKRKIGEEVEPGGRRKAPGRLELLQRFANSHNYDLPEAWDRLGTAARAGAWLRTKGLVAAGEVVSEADAARLRELREAIRGLIVANQRRAPDPASVAVVRRAAARAELRVALHGDGRTTLEPAARGVNGAVATLLVILHEAQLSGDWERMKGCRECEYAFYDRSKNRSAAWCAMSICGNRTKNRAFYRRRRAEA